MIFFSPYCAKSSIYFCVDCKKQYICTERLNFILLFLMNKLALLLGGIALSSLMSVNAQTISSPDGQLTVNLYMSAEGTPMFNVEYANSTVISKSPLGLQTSVGDFTKGLKQDNVSANFEVSQSYDLPNAKKAHIEFKANEQTVSYSKK